MQFSAKHRSSHLIAADPQRYLVIGAFARHPVRSVEERECIVRLYCYDETREKCVAAITCM